MIIKTTARRKLFLFLVIVIGGMAVTGLLFALKSNEGHANETSAARKVADEYLVSVQACSLDKAKQLRKYGISDRDEVTLLCAKGCKPFNFTYVKVSEKLKTEVIPGDPEQEPLKSVTFQYQMTCGTEHKPYMMGMDYNYEENKWQVFLDSSIGDPSSL